MKQIDFVVTIWRGKWLLLLTVVLGAVGAVAAYAFSPSIYRSTAVFRVQSSAPVGDGQAQGPSISAESFIGLVNQAEFQQEVVGTMKSGLPPYLGDIITAERTSGTSLFRVHANASSAKQSKVVADNAVKILLEKSARVAGDDPTRSRITEQLLDPTIAEIEKLTVSVEEARARSGASSPDNSESLSRINQLLDQLRLAEPSLVEPESAQTNAQVLEALRDEMSNLADTPVTADGKSVTDRTEIANLSRKIQNLEKAYSVYWDYMIQMMLRETVAGEHLIVVSQPQQPAGRYTGNVITNSAIGALMGLLVGLLVAILEEGRRRTKLERAEDFNKEDHGASSSTASGGFGI